MKQDGKMRKRGGSEEQEKNSKRKEMKDEEEAMLGGPGEEIRERKINKRSGVAVEVERRVKILQV